VTEVTTRVGTSQNDGAISIMERFTSTFVSKAVWNRIPSSPSLIHKIDTRKASRFVSKIDFGSGQVSSFTFYF
ncbi:unnamed protein product, partial [Brassica rapa]